MVNSFIMLKNLEIIDYDVFGMKKKNIASDWRRMFSLAKALKKGSPAYKLFVSQVDICYGSLATIIIKDLDSSLEYELRFDNVKKLWDLNLKNIENKGDPDTEIDPKEKIEFFHNDFVKSCIARAHVVLTETKQLLDDIVMEKVGNGDYLDVNETKLEAELHMLGDAQLMDNLKKRLFIK